MGLTPPELPPLEPLLPPVPPEPPPLLRSSPSVSSASGSALSMGGALPNRLALPPLPALTVNLMNIPGSISSPGLMLWSMTTPASYSSLSASITSTSSPRFSSWAIALSLSKPITSGIIFFESDSAGARTMSSIPTTSSRTPAAIIMTERSFLFSALSFSSEVYTYVRVSVLFNVSSPLNLLLFQAPACASLSASGLVLSHHVPAELIVAAGDEHEPCSAELDHVILMQFGHAEEHLSVHIGKAP